MALTNFLKDTGKNALNFFKNTYTQGLPSAALKMVIPQAKTLGNLANSYLNKSQPQSSNQLPNLTSPTLSGPTKMNAGQSAAALSKPTPSAPSTTSYGSNYNYSGSSTPLPPPSGNYNFNEGGSQMRLPDFTQNSSASINDEPVSSQGANSSVSTPNPFSDQLKALQDRLTGLSEGLTGYLKPGQQESDTQSQLDALQGKLKGVTASRDLGLANVSNQPIAMNFITGQSANLQRQAAAQAGALGAEAEPLTTKLARLQADRQSGFDAAKYQIGNAQGELERLQNESKPIEIGGNLVRLNPTTGQYETIFKAPEKQGAAAEGFTLGEGQMRYDAQGNLIASGAPKTAAEQLTNDIKEYNFARQQGYGGSFTDFKNSNAGGGSLPAAYREYQLGQSDPGFAQYLNRNSVNGNGRPLSDSQAKLISEGNQIGQSLQPIYSLIQNQANLFGPYNGLGGYNPLNVEAQAANAQLKTAAQLVGGYLEGGKLTDQDIGRYQNILPKLTDKPEVAQKKLDAIAQLIQNKQQQYLQDFGSAGFNTSGFGGNQQGQGQQSQINPQDLQQLRSAGYTDQQIQQFQQQRGFNSPPSMGVKGSFEQKYPQGATGGQCASFARKLVDIPPLGNGLNDKKAHVDKIGISATQWRQNPQIGDVIISNDNPTYGHVYVVNQKLPDGRLQVSESNYHGNEKVTHTRIVSPNDSKIYGAIRRPLKV